MRYPAGVKERDESRDDDRPVPVADPLHSTESFAARHLLRLLLVLVALGVLVAAHTLLNCTGD